MNSNPLNGNELFDNQLITSPADPYSVTQQLSENVILTTLDDLYNWARMSSPSRSNHRCNY